MEKILNESRKDKIKIPKASKSLTKEFKLSDSSSLNYWNNLIDNPDSVLQKLGKDVKIYNELLADPHLYACVQSRKSGVMSLDWEIDQGESEKAVADLIESLFNNYDIFELSRVILDAPLFGYQPIEILWEIIDNKIVPIDLFKRPRHHFKFDISRKLIFIDDYGNEKEVPEFKFIVPSYESSRDNPYGVPLLSKCYWSVVLKNDVRKFWSIFTEKFGAPWVNVSYERSAVKDEDEITELVNSIYNMANDNVFAVPKEVMIELINGASRGNHDLYLEFIKKCEEQISEVILGHTSATSSTPGKLGNEDMATDVVDRIISADKHLVQKTFNQLIKMIVDLNFTTDVYPKFRFYEEEDINVERAQRDKIIAESLIGKFSKEYLMRKFNYYEEDILDQPEPTGDKSPKKSVSPSDFMNYMNSDDGEKEQKITDEFVDYLIEPKRADKMFNKILKPIFDFVGDKSLEDLKKDYHKIYKKIDTDDFVEQMERALLIIHLFGSVSADLTEDEENNINLDYFNKGDNLKLEDLIFALDKEPKEIVKYFKSKGVAISSDWESTFKLIKQHVFTVSGVMKMDMLMDFKEMIEKAIKYGLSQSEFKKQLKDRFRAKGWLSKSENSKLISAWRLDNIYRTNLQSEFMNGRWNNHQMNIELFPYVQNFSTLDPSTTKECKALDGKVFRVDDKYYAKHLRPPGHFGCRRRTIAISETLLKKRGLSVSKGTAFSKHRNAKGFDNKGEAFMPDKSKYTKELWNEYEKEK